MNILIEDVRDKFEAWAIENGHNLTRHPNDEDFYFNRDVSMLWVCFSNAYALGREDQTSSFADELTDILDEYQEPTPAQAALLERMQDD